MKLRELAKRYKALDLRQKALHVQSFFLALFLVALPFNLTKQLPETGFISSAYSNGYFINYLLSYVSVQDIAATLLLAALIIGYFIKKERLNRGEKLTIFVWSSYMLLHNAIFMNFTTLLYSIRITIFLILIIYLRTFFNEIKSTARRLEIYKVLIYILCFSIVVQLLISANQVAQGNSLGLWYLGESQVSQGMINSSFLDIKGNYYLRAYGTFPHPNVLGGYLVISILALKSLKTHFNQDKFIKSIATISMLLALAAILLTFSRISILLGSIFILADQLETLTKYFKNRLLVIIPLTERVASIFSSADLSLQERLKLIESTEQIIRKSPWTGVGWQQFTAILSANPPVTINGISLIQPVHNIFLLLIAENGVILGSIISVLVLLFFILQIKTSNNRLLSTLVLTTLLTIGIWDHYLLTLPQGNALFVILALIPAIAATSTIKATQRS